MPAMARRPAPATAEPDTGVITAGQPLVTLGVPVYNGGKHLEAALESVLCQDYPNLEILISDNASTDSTEATCRGIAARDPRVRYLRQPSNLGSLRNFHLLAQEAKGLYFAWCAHDDIRHPEFVSRCVEALEQNPGAVLCNGEVGFLDEEGQAREDWKDRNFSTLGLSLPARLERLIDHMDWVDMYGLIRRKALLEALPIEPVWGGDVVLSMKLLLRGDFCKVPRPLFQYRVRSKPKAPGQIMKEVTGDDRGIDQPYTELVQTLFRVAFEGVPDPRARGEISLRFLRILADLEATGPHPCWRDILTHEHGQSLGLDRSRPAFLRQVLSWLHPGIRETEPDLLPVAMGGVTRILLLGPRPGALWRKWPPNLVEEIQRRFPDAEIKVLGPTPGPPGAPSQAWPDLAREQSFALVQTVSEWGPDLLLNPFRVAPSDPLAGALATCRIPLSIGLRRRHPFWRKLISRRARRESGAIYLLEAQKGQAFLRTLDEAMGQAPGLS